MADTVLSHTYHGRQDISPKHLGRHDNGSDCYERLLKKKRVDNFLFKIVF